MNSSNQPNEPSHAVDIQALKKLRSEQGSFFSLYLDLRAKKPPAEDVVTRFDNLLRQVEEEKRVDQDPPEVREQWLKEVDRIRGWLETERPQGQGLAVFSAQSAGVWRVIPLPAGVLDRLVVRDRAYTRPLEILRDEFIHTLAILMDANQARLVQIFTGKAQEVARIPASADAVAERAQAVWQEHNFQRLILAGNDEKLAALRETLPEHMRERVAVDADLSPLAELEDIAAQVKEIEDHEEWSKEVQRVQELLTTAAKGEGAVLGLEQTMLSVRAGKVRLLIAEEDFQLPGGKCPNCGFIGEGKEGICLLCGMALRPEPDIIEAALKRVLDKGGEIEVLRGPESCRALAEYGRIGALLYPPGESPTELDMAQRRLLAKDGEINPDALHDEAMEESFPASDPPGWTSGP